MVQKMVQFGLVLVVVLVCEFLGQSVAYVAPQLQQESPPFEDQLNYNVGGFEESKYDPILANAITSKELQEMDLSLESEEGQVNHKEDSQSAASIQEPQIYGESSNHIERVNNFLQNLANRLRQQSGQVNATLGNLNTRIENGATGLQAFITNFLERKSATVQTVILGISNFFNTSINLIRTVFGGIARGFQRIIQALFNRDLNPTAFKLRADASTDIPNSL